MIKGVLLDVGGVVAIGSAAIPGSIPAIDELRRANLPIRFLTNITRQSRSNVVASLNALGMKTSMAEVFTPSVAARDWLTRNRKTPRLLVHPNLEEDFLGIAPGTGDALVLGDVGEKLDYAALNRAFRILAGDADFIALAQNRVFQDSDGQLSLDAGAFVAALEYASGKRAFVLGKPAMPFFHMAVASIGCRPDEAVMVGDDAEFDTAPARQAGLSAILVKTGKYSAGVEAAYQPIPTAVTENISCAAEWILAHR
jgi:HAD superfamily hydrolase (TIGR01458 family)